MRVLLSSVLVLGACYEKGTIEPCTLTCDEAPCPGALVCGSDHLCQTPGMPICSATDAQTSFGPCIDAWMGMRTLLLSPPVKLPVSSTDPEYSPFVSNGGLELYYVRAIASDEQVWQATRLTTAQDFTGAAVMNGINSPAAEYKLAVEPNRLEGFFASERSGGSGGSSDLWRASRTAPADTFLADQQYLGNVNTVALEIDPHLSPDSLHLYFTRSTSPGNLLHVFLATRASTSSMFATTTRLAELTSVGGENDFSATLTADERVIIFVTNRSAGIGGNNLWYATRTSATTPFGAPSLVPGVNAGGADETPHISEDGCTLYFGSNRTGNADLYQSSVL